MQTVTSADGTAIAYERAGDGPALIFATGAFNDHTRCAGLAEALRDRYTVITYDRRGRGRSGDTRPYAVRREVEDLAALVEVAGGRASVFGYSSGAVLALLAAVTVPVRALVLFEGPFAVGGRVTDPGLPGRIDALVAAGRNGAAVELFQTGVLGMPPETVAGIRQSPMWPGLEAMAQSTVYDATIVAGPADPTPEMLAVGVPTLVLAGEATWPMLSAAGRMIAGALGDARFAEVAGGESHDIPVGATARAVDHFLGSVGTS